MSSLYLCIDFHAGFLSLSPVLMSYQILSKNH